MQNLTRQQKWSSLAPFAPYATQEKVLVVGERGTYTNPYFPNMVIVNSDRGVGPQIVADAHELPFDGGSFDVIIAPMLMNRVRDPFKVMTEFHRVLKPGGTLIFGAPFVYAHVSAPEDYWRFTRKGIEQMCAAFSSVAITAKAGAFYSIAILLDMIILRTDVYGGKFTKMILLGVSRLCSHLDWLVKKSYGKIQKTAIKRLVVPEIIAPEYFVVARK